MDKRIRHIQAAKALLLINLEERCRLPTEQARQIAEIAYKDYINNTREFLKIRATCYEEHMAKGYCITFLAFRSYT